MHTLFGFLMLLSMLGLTLGLIKPGLVMWFNLHKKRSAVFFPFAALAISFSILWSSTSQDAINDTQRFANSYDSANTANNKTAVIKNVNEGNIVNDFREKLDSLYQSYNQKDIVFSTYKENIDPIFTALNDTINYRKKSGLKSEKLVRLYKKSQQTFGKASADYLVYGDGDEVSLRASAEEFLNENALDPGSVNVQDAYKCGKQKQGWVYYVRYRAKNPYGALILTDVKLLMRYDTSSSMYNIIKAY